MIVIINVIVAMRCKLQMQEYLPSKDDNDNDNA
jgi:hypothetical protein